MDLESKATKLAFFAPKIFDAIHENFPQPNNNLLTIERYRILLYVFNHEHCKLKDITDHMHLASSTVSELVGRMVREKVLIRKRNEYNRRQLVIDVSEVGIQLLQEYRQNIQQQFMEQLQLLGEEEQNRMLSVYEQIYDFFLLLKQKKEKGIDAVRTQIARHLAQS